MANLEGFKQGFDKRLSRNFGEKFKKDMVKRIEDNEFSVREISGLYGVSTTAVYKWVHKYSILYQKGYKQIVEPMSGTKKIKELQARIRELEQAVGQKQMKVDFLEKLIEITGEDLGIDIKKKAGSRPRSGSGSTAKE